MNKRTPAAHDKSSSTGKHGLDSEQKFEPDLHGTGLGLYNNDYDNTYTETSSQVSRGTRLVFVKSHQQCNRPGANAVKTESIFDGATGIFGHRSL